MKRDAFPTTTAVTWFSQQHARSAANPTRWSRRSAPLALPLPPPRDRAYARASYRLEDAIFAAPQQIVDGEVTPAQPDETEKMGNHVAILTGRKQVPVEADELTLLASAVLIPAPGSFSTIVLGKVVGLLRRVVPDRARPIVDRLRVFPNGPIGQDAGSRLCVGLAAGWQLLSLTLCWRVSTLSEPNAPK